jgi:uncharacterized protein with von Willebrand factor type A (vWA) domain
VFAFGTRLTRLTGALSVRDPDAAIAAAAVIALTASASGAPASYALRASPYTSSR